MRALWWVLALRLKSRKRLEAENLSFLKISSAAENLAQRQGESDIHHHGKADNLG
jgi:hypothetical protein